MEKFVWLGGEVKGEGCFFVWVLGCGGLGCLFGCWVRVYIFSLLLIFWGRGSFLGKEVERVGRGLEFLF